jgi:hypothetical protein
MLGKIYDFYILKYKEEPLKNLSKLWELVINFVKEEEFSESFLLNYLERRFQFEQTENLKNQYLDVDEEDISQIIEQYFN